MNNAVARELAIKLFGLYCVTRVAMAVSQLAAGLFSDFDSWPGYWVGMGMIGLAYLGVAWLCLFKTKLFCGWLFSDADDDSGKDATMQGFYSMSFWVSLIGLFYLVSSTSVLVAAGFPYVMEKLNSYLYYYPFEFGSNTVVFALSLVCILGSRRYERFATGTPILEGEDDTPNPSTDREA